MIDRQSVKEFLVEGLDETVIPVNILFNDLLETFCKYIENDYYEWLNDNYKSFFNHGNPDWKYIKEQIEQHSKNR